MTVLRYFIEADSFPDTVMGEPMERHRWWQVIAVTGTFETVFSLQATGYVDICTSQGINVMRLAWLFLPVITIASVVVVAGTATQRWERWLAGLVAVSLTAGWVLGLVWADVAMAFDHPMC